MAIIALMLTLQVSASTVSPFHKVFNKSLVRGPHSSIADLFGSSEEGIFLPGVSNAGSFGEGRHSRYGRITRFGTAAAAGSVFSRKAERLKEYLSEHGYEGGVFNRDSIREWWLGREEVFTGITTEIDATPPGVAASAVPVPAAVWLFGSGLVALFGFARRRRA